jgi:hypothetical protein
LQLFRFWKMKSNLNVILKESWLCVLFSVRTDKSVLELQFCCKLQLSYFMYHLDILRLLIMLKKQTKCLPTSTVCFDTVALRNLSLLHWLIYAFFTVRGVLGNKCAGHHNLKTVKIREIMWKYNAGRILFCT